MSFLLRFCTRFPLGPEKKDLLSLSLFANTSLCVPSAFLILSAHLSSWVALLVNQLVVHLNAYMICSVYLCCECVPVRSIRLSYIKRPFKFVASDHRKGDRNPIAIWTSTTCELASGTLKTGKYFKSVDRICSKRRRSASDRICSKRCRSASIAKSGDLKIGFLLEALFH